MKPFTEYFNDKLVQASRSVLSGNNNLVEQNEPKPIKPSDVQAGDTVEWYNGPITFREKVFEKDGKLYVTGTPGSRPILVSSIRLPLHLAQKSDDNAKAVRASKRETELLKTREKSLADKRKRTGLTGGSPIKFVEASSDQLSALSTVMRSMGASLGDINTVRSKLDSEVSGKFLLALATIIANNTDAFNAFVKAQSKEKNN